MIEDVEPSVDYAAPLKYVELRHDCDQPSTTHLPSYGSRGQVIAKWRCPECRQRWAYAASFLHGDRFYWVLVGQPSRRWRKAEARRLREKATRPIPPERTDQ